ncbi:MAG TPA: carbonic anhydrase [Acidimicrobiales bacterium]|nr:carbonic anhydrase [Acidimicrobiales bacterium]
MSTDELLARNAEYSAVFDKAGLPAAPARRLAVLACMDARLDPARALGLEEGDAHVIRNAGGVATDDAVRSLVISQRLLGTDEILLLHHTGCGMTSFRDDDLKDRIQAETGLRPPFAMEAFADAEEDVRQTAARLVASPFVDHRHLRGFVYDIDTGRLREVPLG